MDSRTALSEPNPRAGSFTAFAEVETSRGSASWQSPPEVEVYVSDIVDGFGAHPRFFSTGWCHAGLDRYNPLRRCDLKVESPLIVRRLIPLQ